MNTFAAWLTEIGSILVASGPYLLAGFLIAGLIQVLLPEGWVNRQLGGRDWRSILKAALVGAPVPLCSCSVVPTAITLRRRGASRGATTSFLVATPETGVDSIGISWALLDPLLTITRPIAAIVTAVTAGGLVERYGEGRDAADADPECGPGTETGACTEGGEDPCHDHDHAHDHTEYTRRENEGPVSVINRATRFAFGPLMADLTPWFVLGFAASAVITLAVPDGFFGATVPNGLPAMLAMLVVSIPLYVCATASTPVAAALVLKGLDPGAALVLLLAGPATNLATIGVITGFLGRRSAFLYVMAISVISVALGLLTNALYPLLGLDPSAIVSDAHSEHGAFSVLCGAILGVSLLVHAVRERVDLRFSRSVARGLRRMGLIDAEAGERAAALTRLLTYGILLFGWGSTMLTNVRPGETGFRMRFGAVVAERSDPGPLWHAPWPLERVERVRRNEVRQTRFGPDGTGPDWLAGDYPGLALLREPGERDLEAEAELTTADEALLRVTYVVHWTVDDAGRYRFHLEDPESLVRGLTESALRHVAAVRQSDQLLLEERSRLEKEALEVLARGMAPMKLGLRASSVHILELHAPSEVHDAYRDVASSLEDRARERRRAQRHANERLARARGSAARKLEEARAARAHALARARGAAAAFEELVDAMADEPRIARDRLRAEVTEKILEAARLVLVLGERIDVEWVDGGLPRTGEQEDR